MRKHKKHKIISNRLKPVKEQRLFKLYNRLPFKCQSCCYNANCPQIKDMNDTKDCNNYKMAYDLNDIIDIMHEQNVNLFKFAKDYGLKYKFLMQYLKGYDLMPYKYYSCIMDRLLEKNEFLKYEDRFKDNEYENYTSNRGDL